MENKYIIKEESVNYVFGTTFDGKFEFSTATRYVVYEVNEENEVCMNGCGWFEEEEEAEDELKIATYIDRDFIEHPAIFHSFELAKLFTEGRFGVVMTKDM